jgi:ABC-2 type transport system permease protein
MFRNLFTKTLYDNRRSLFWWCLGSAFFVAFVIPLYPSIKGQPELNQIFQNSKELSALIGTTDVTSPYGYLIRELFSIMGPLFLIIYGISLGTGAVAGEEGKKTLGLLLANPIERWRVVQDKFLAMLVSLTLVSVLAMFLLGLAFGSIGFLIGAITGNRSLASGIAGAIAFAMYMFDFLRQVVESLDPYRFASLFYYYGTNTLLVEPAHWGNLAVLAAVPVLCIGLSALVFSRRDINT